MNKQRLLELAGIQIDEEYTDVKAVTKEYMKWRGIEKEDHEPEDWNGLVDHYNSMFGDLFTKPIQKAFAIATKDGDVIYKDYRNLLEFLLGRN